MSNKSFKKILELCTKISEGKNTYNIHGDEYKKEDIINFATKYDPTVISLYDALDIIKRMNLFQEIKRVLITKDKSFDY